MGGLPAAGARLAAVFAATSGWWCWRRHQWPWQRLWPPLARRLRAAAPASRGQARQRSGVRAAACGEDGQLVQVRPALCYKPLPAGTLRCGVRAAADLASGFRLPSKRQLVVVSSALQPLRGGPTFYLEWEGALCAACVLLAWLVVLLHCELACSSLQLMLALRLTVHAVSCILHV
jgi:hypothetical protein